MAPALNAVSRLVPMAGLFVLLLASLYIMSDATQNSERFGELYIWLLLVNSLALVFLAVLIGVNLFQAVRQRLKEMPGSRLTIRLVVIFVLLALVPVSVVYYFSVKFLDRGIDSWFDVQVEAAFEDAIELSRRSLDFRLRQALSQTRRVADRLAGGPEQVPALVLNDLRASTDAVALTLVGANNRIIASSSEETTRMLPSLPPEAVRLRIQSGKEYVALEPRRGEGLQVRAVVPVPTAGGAGDRRYLQARFPVADRLSDLANRVQKGFSRYKELVYLRTPLKQSFTLTLSLVLLLSVLSAVWAAFFAARRLVSPIRELAEGTKAVAAGEYHKKLPVGHRDELGFLVRSFNEMTAKLAAARDEADRNRRQLERQRAYLQTVLQHLSSGVISLDADLSLRTSNVAAEEILETDLSQQVGRSLSDLSAGAELLQHFYQGIGPLLEAERREWQEQVVVFGHSGRKVLMCHGARLPQDSALQGGHVIVFDDITALIQAQRDAAWGEVARRLAHEIKNPLTPIQLSAERLRQKVMPRLSDQDAQVLQRSTHTIVQQVEAMKAMVNAFSQYARGPAMANEPVALNQLVGEVAELYRSNQQQVQVQSHLDETLPPIEADPARIRQLLHNLITNGLEALQGTEGGRLDLTTRRVTTRQGQRAELEVRDNGPGVPQAMLANLFEPYVTGKAKGTGLGLAIVKKIVEEHGGIVWAENPAAGGARIVIQLPAEHRPTASKPRQQQERP